MGVRADARPSWRPIVWGEQAAAIDTSQMLAGPSPEHWAGTDNLGRDILARVLVATRLSVVLALSATAVAVSVGLLLGSGPMLVGRRVGAPADRRRQRGGGLSGAAAGALLRGHLRGRRRRAPCWPSAWPAHRPSRASARRSSPASATATSSIAARIAGVGRGRILVRHVLPNIGEPLVVNATIGAGGALLAFAGLSFLGLGVQAPDYDWGRLLQDGLTGIYVQPVGALAPGLAIVVAGLAFNLFGETIAKGFGVGVADAARPRTAATATGAAPARRGPGAGGARRRHRPTGRPGGRRRAGARRART